MKPKHPSSFLCALLFLGCASNSSTAPNTATPPPASAGAEQAAPEGPVIPLRFAWPDGLALRIVSKRTDNKSGQPRTIESESVMRAQAADGRVRVTEGDYKILSSQGMSEGEARTTQVMASAAMTSLIKADGTFETLENVEAHVANARRAVEAGNKNLTGEQLAAAQQVFSPALLNGLAQVEWHDRVGFWANNDLELGAVYELSSEAALPFPGSPTVKLLTRFAASELVPCAAGEAPRCVRIETHTDVDPSDMSRATVSLLNSMGAPADGPIKIEALELTTEVVLITDPATLVPRSFTKVKRTRIVMQTPDGPKETAAMEERQLTFTPIGAN